MGEPSKNLKKGVQVCNNVRCSLSTQLTPFFTYLHLLPISPICIICLYSLSLSLPLPFFISFSLSLSLSLPLSISLYSTSSSYMYIHLRPTEIRKINSECQHRIQASKQLLQPQININYYSVYISTQILELQSF